MNHSAIFVSIFLGILFLSGCAGGGGTTEPSTTASSKASQIDPSSTTKNTSSEDKILCNFPELNIYEDSENLGDVTYFPHRADLQLDEDHMALFGLTVISPQLQKESFAGLLSFSYVLSPDSLQQKKLEDCLARKKKISMIQTHNETIHISSEAPNSSLHLLKNIPRLPRQNMHQISITTEVSKSELNQILSLIEQKKSSVFFHCADSVNSHRPHQLCTPINLQPIYSSVQSYVVRR